MKNKTLNAAKAKRFDRENEEANQFAMALLMPEQFVRAEIAKMGGIDLCSDDAVKALAKKFQVPSSLMAIRIGQLKSFPTP